MKNIFKTLFLAPFLLIGILALYILLLAIVADVTDSSRTFNEVLDGIAVAVVVLLSFSIASAYVYGMIQIFRPPTKRLIK